MQHSLIELQKLRRATQEGDKIGPYNHDNSITMNCVMLITWPKRKEMINESIISFISQKYKNKFLTIVNDGQLCKFTKAFTSRAFGHVENTEQKYTIGEKRNIGASIVESDVVVTMDDDDFSFPNRLRNHSRDFSLGNVYSKSESMYIAVDKLTCLVGIRQASCYCTSAVLRDIAIKYKWEHCDYGEDDALFHKIKGKEKIIHNSVGNTYIHRRHGGNISLKITGETESWYSLKSNGKIKGVTEDLRKIIGDNYDEYITWR
jgi:hypothetical protein